MSIMTLTLRTLSQRIVLLSLLTVTLAAAPVAVYAAEGEPVPAAESAQKLVEVLQSNAPAAEKAIVCKKLAIYGGKDAVGSLAALLSNAELASWARIALEAIPDPDADAVLRQALGKLQGRLLVGAINSIGVRRDPKAVDGLVAKLNDADTDVVSAAAAALGRIGGDASAKALTQALTKVPAGARSAVAEGALRCAELALAGGQSKEAIALYDAVRQAELPKHKVLEGVRGAILARQSAGLPLLLEQLKSADKAQFNMGLRVARELPGREVTEALSAEIKQVAADKQVWLFLALADRADAAVMPAILQAAKSGPVKLRVAAVTALDRLGSTPAIPVLLEAAADNDLELARAAKNALGRLPGKEVDADLLGRLVSSSGKMRQALVEVAGQRRIPGSLPVIVKCSEDADAGVRLAAYATMGGMGGESEIDSLVKLFVKNDARKERAAIEKSLLAICGRCGAAATPGLAPMLKSEDSALRILALHALSSVGGHPALEAVKSALVDKDSAVEDEAVRTLSTWPNNWPEDNAVAEPLLALAKDGKSTAHQVLAVRGYLEYVAGDKNLKNDDKVTKIKEFMPLIQRAEEKKLALVTLGNIPAAASLELLGSFTTETALSEDAWAATVNLLRKEVPGVSADLKVKTLQSAVASAKEETTRKNAEKALKAIK
jgi:HEAT repeat protein